MKKTKTMPSVIKDGKRITLGIASWRPTSVSSFPWRQQPLSHLVSKRDEDTIAWLTENKDKVSQVLIMVSNDFLFLFPKVNSLSGTERKRKSVLVLTFAIAR